MTYQTKDTRDGVFERQFLCRVPAIETMSVDYIRAVGMPTTGSEYYDQDIRNEIVDRYMSIAEMASYYGRGVSISIVDYNQTAVIYGLVQDHLHAWRTEIHQSYDASHAPIEDLVILDRFANAVYGKAKYVFDSKFVEDNFARTLSSIFSGSLGGFDLDVPTKRAKVLDPMTGEIDDGFEKRESLETLFLNRLS